MFKSINFKIPYVFSWALKYCQGNGEGMGWDGLGGRSRSCFKLSVSCCSSFSWFSFLWRENTHMQIHMCVFLSMRWFLEQKYNLPSIFKYTSTFCEVYFGVFLSLKRCLPMVYICAVAQLVRIGRKILHNWPLLWCNSSKECRFTHQPSPVFSLNSDS